jgi:4-hydroxybutyrate CoA-transferase
MANWEEHFKSRLITPEQAAELVQPGMRVHFPPMHGPAVPLALAKRAQKLEGPINLRLASPLVDLGWGNGTLSPFLNIEFELFVGNVARPLHDRKLAPYLPNLFSTSFKAHDERPTEDKPVDIVFVTTTPPNSKGFVSFGAHQWNKRMYVRRAHCAVAEIDRKALRTYGDVYMHVSEFDYFVELRPDVETVEDVMARMDPAKREAVNAIIAEAGLERVERIKPYLERSSPYDLRLLLGLVDPPEEFKTIAGYLSEVVEDEATIQIGIGDPSSQMARLGAFDAKHDLGLHSEMVAPKVAKLVEAGVINGRKKTIHRGKAVAVAWSGSDPEDYRIIDDNPRFELYDPEYVLNISTIAANHKQTAINNAISVDLAGQITVETAGGGRFINGTGGLPELHIGAFISRGGRAITLLPSTALGGRVSRIVPQLETGTLVTIPRFFADTVITEYGIARLLGKNHRERAAELIAVAHPDFRFELSRAAKQLFG